ncbi:MAG: peroxiredoxin [Planctomycetes bacterium]|nr:peroxiredoxin [Planctomycetota bacterium]
MLELNDPAPDFNLPSTSGKSISLKELRGKRVVLYFYPKDDTPGCTTEACDFRDSLVRLKSRSAVVLGVSKDSLTSHSKFRAKYELPFDLLSDEGNAIAKAYGAYGQKLMYGKLVEGTIRSTFVIDENGKLVARWSPVNVEGHVDEVLAQLTVLSDGPAPKQAAVKAKSSAAKVSAPRPATPSKTQLKAQPQKTAPEKAGAAQVVRPKGVAPKASDTVKKAAKKSPAKR